MKFEEEWSFLNPYQMTAVLDESPACVVNANVGSGKTTVLIAKILYLYQVKQIQPEEMIVLTFTNKAADEIKERLIAKEKFLKKEKNDEEPRLDGFLSGTGEPVSDEAEEPGGHSHSEYAGPCRKASGGRDPLLCPVPTAGYCRRSVRGRGERKGRFPGRRLQDCI